MSGEIDVMDMGRGGTAIVNAEIRKALARTAELETQLAAAQVDNAGLLDILRQLDYTSSPERAQRILDYVRAQEHPGRELMARALAEWNEAQQALERAETTRRAAIQRGAADHAVAAAARALRAAVQPLGSMARLSEACAVFDAAVAVADKAGEE